MLDEVATNGSSITDILRYGFIGLSFLLAAMSYMLLRAEGRRDHPLIC